MPPLTVTVPPVPTWVVQVAFEYTENVTEPEAVEAAAPASVAKSITLVAAGTPMEGPLKDPPDSDVVMVVGTAPGTICSTSLPHVVTDGSLVVSPL